MEHPAFPTNFRQMSTPSWSRDGRWIYFKPGQFGEPGIYRCAMMGGNAVRVGGQVDGWFPQESFDGSVLYSASRQVNTGLLMFSLDGAFPESAVEGLPPIIHEGLWTVVPGGIYFVPVDAPQSLRYFDLATKKNPANLRSSEKLWHGLVRLAGRPVDSLFASGRGQHRHHARRSLPIACDHRFGGGSFFELLAPQGWIIVGNSPRHAQSAREWLTSG
jgi:hypothetical protein